MLTVVTRISTSRRPWIEVFQGLGVGLSWNSHPWNVRGGITDLFEKSIDRYVEDDVWLKAKRELGLRKVNIWVEWWNPEDQRERVEVERRRATVSVLAFRDAERARQADDPIKHADWEVRAVFGAALESLLAEPSS